MSTAAHMLEAIQQWAPELDWKIDGPKSVRAWLSVELDDETALSWTITAGRVQSGPGYAVVLEALGDEAGASEFFAEWAQESVCGALSKVLQAASEDYDVEAAALAERAAAYRAIVAEKMARLMGAQASPAEAQPPPDVTAYAVLGYLDRLADAADWGADYGESPQAAKDLEVLHSAMEVVERLSVSPRSESAALWTATKEAIGETPAFPVESTPLTDVERQELRALQEYVAAIDPAWDGEAFSRLVAEGREKEALPTWLKEQT